MPRPLACCCFAIFSLLTTQVAALHVVSSVKPLELLAAAVIAENDTTSRILSGAQSPHHYSLRPSDIKKLHSADLIVWTGDNMEPYLSKALQSLAKSIPVINVSQLQISKPEVKNHDPHYWLNPVIAANIATEIAVKLTSIDAKNSGKYINNAAILQEKIGKIDKQAKKDFDSLQQYEFIVLHDAYSHFIQHYQLKQYGSLSDSADHHHGAKNRAQLQGAINNKRVHCVITEEGDELNSSQKSLIRGGGITVEPIDPLARSITVSDQGYIQFYQQVIAGFSRCLGHNKTGMPESPIE